MYSNFLKSSLLAGGDLHLGSSALVAEKLGVHALCRAVSLTLGLLDAVSVLLCGLVVCRVILGLCHSSNKL